MTIEYKEIGFTENKKCQFCNLLAYYEIKHVFHDIYLCHNHFTKLNELIEGQ